MRLRITFSKTGALRYTGHLDLQTIWERTIRRAGLPLAYTQGFHPGPKIQIASALPLGFIGRAEIVDIWLNEAGDLLSKNYKDLLQPAAPPGLIILGMEEVDERGPALQTQVVAAQYQVTLLDAADRPALERKMAEALAAISLPRERRGKAYDLRPLVESLELLPGGDTEVLRMTLTAREGATGRPEEVLDALAIPPDAARVERTRLILAGDKAG